MLDVPIYGRISAMQLFRPPVRTPASGVVWKPFC